MKHITICADDYALTPGISKAIRQLIRNGRLSATSAMTSTPYWQSEGLKLRHLKSTIKIGLHFDLTESIAPLKIWVINSLLGTIDAEIIEQALRSQFKAFQDIMGRNPDYIDSHQHVHTFPHIRKVFLNTLADLSPNKKIPIRSLSNTILPSDSPIKNWIIKRLSSGFEKQAHLYPTNAAFAGFYSLKETAPFPSMLNTWLVDSPENTLIMVHPGIGESSPNDSIHPARTQEFDYLNSPQFASFIETNQILLNPTPIK